MTDTTGNFDLALRAARAEDVERVRTILEAAAADLTARFGEGHWSRVSAVETLRRHADQGTLFLAEIDGAAIGAMQVTDRKVSFYRGEWFAHPKDAAAYLLDMAIEPAHQRRGLGRRAMALAEELARARGLPAIRLDAYGGPAGAGGFYAKCGYRLVHTGTFNGIALEYFEKLLGPPAK
jgi:GNAT superfamily N-acetyltransferase